MSRMLIRAGAFTAAAGLATVAGVVATSSASASTTTRTMHLVGKQSEPDITKQDKDVSGETLSRNGSAVGYDVSSCRFDFATHTAHCRIALAFDRGILYVKADLDVDTGQATGSVVGGTQAFAGATGTATAEPGTEKNTTAITIRYQV